MKRILMKSQHADKKKMMKELDSVSSVRASKGKKNRFGLKFSLLEKARKNLYYT